MGLFEYLVMLENGLENGCMCYSHSWTVVLHETLNRYGVVHIDDILVYSVYVKDEKCHFHLFTLSFLSMCPKALFLIVLYC